MGVQQGFEKAVIYRASTVITRGQITVGGNSSVSYEAIEVLFLIPFVSLKLNVVDLTNLSKHLTPYNGLFSSRSIPDTTTRKNTILCNTLP